MIADEVFNHEIFSGAEVVQWLVSDGAASGEQRGVVSEQGKV